MNFVKGQQVLINDRTIGTIIDISVRKGGGEGLINGLDKAKVRYTDGHGGMNEAWFAFDKLAEVTVTVTAKKKDMVEAERQTVSETPRDQVEWVEQPKSTSNIIKGINTAESHDQSDFMG